MNPTNSQTDLSPVEEALGFAELSIEEQKEILLDLSELIYKGTMIRVMERMDESHKDAFHALIDGNASQEEIATFIEKHVPDADAAVQETVAELTSDILAVTKA